MKKYLAKHIRRLSMVAITAAITSLGVTVGCQQKMAEQPAPRTYEHLSAKPATGDKNQETYSASWFLPPDGTVHRGKLSAIDPLVTGLTEQGRKPHKAYPPEYLSKIPAAQAKLLEDAVSQSGVPDNVDNFVKSFPWKLTEADLQRGQQRYNVECAVCHGASGNGKGKIAERGTLWPPSYHRDPAGLATDVYGFNKADTGSEKIDLQTVLKYGHSRGFHRFGVNVALDEVPVGYIFEVITRGYGSMPYLRDKVPAEDRWRIAAYVKSLQLSQGAKYADLPADVKTKFDSAVAAKKAEVTGGATGGASKPDIHDHAPAQPGHDEKKGGQ